MFPSPTPPPRRQSHAGNWRVDNSVNNHGTNFGSMTGGSINLHSAASTPSQAKGRGFDQAGFGVFINYRRHGSHEATVALLHRELVHHFGASRVFLDRSSLEPGARYPDQVWLCLNASRVMLCVIHPDWLDELWRRRDPRRMDRKDWVAFEIEAALKAHKVLIPVLLDDTKTIKPDQLPEEIRDLAYRHRFRLRVREYANDLGQLVEAVTPHLMDGAT